MVGCMEGLNYLTQSSHVSTPNMIRSTMAAALVALLWVLAGGAATAATQESIKSVDPNDGWRLTSQNNGVVLYARVRAGSHLKEFKATADIDAPTAAVNAVSNDI